MSRLDRRRILLVDDNEATCTLLAALLGREYELEIAHDGGSAIERLRTSRYAAILLDLKMPDVDGFAVLEQLRQVAADQLQRVLVVTAALSERELQRVGEYQVAGVVRKPFDIEELQVVVRRCIEGADGVSVPDIFCNGPAVLLLLADLLRYRYF